MDEWPEINTQIAKSKIKRYPWSGIFGVSLTELILTMKNQGYTSDEVTETIYKNSKLKAYAEKNFMEAEKIHDNIRISVCARFGENNSAERIKLKLPDY